MLNFVIVRYDGLGIQQQKELIHALNSAGINIDKAREQFIYFHITMNMELVERAVTLRTFIARYLDGILGFDHEWLFDYIKDNRSEWSGSVYIEKDNEGDWMIYPAV